MAYFFQNTATGLVLWGIAIAVLIFSGLICYFARVYYIPWITGTGSWGDNRGVVKKVLIKRSKKT